jgi:hypothetical protein
MTAAVAAPTPAAAERAATPISRSTLCELDVVRLTALHGRAANHLSVARAQRAPRIGDVGSIIQVFATGDQARYLVESVTGEGETIWLAELAADETLESDFEARRRAMHDGCQLLKAHARPSRMNIASCDILQATAGS